ncbi:hypothetical protein F5Y18DRAFT_442164 [Xylariaceae sp. FL1019]|nr:hypothetical protein F5Y18DRAFT_442164 [Xylariaceae sp. FL1019]
MAQSLDNAIGQALVDFALGGVFPEDDVSSQRIQPRHLAPALQSLAAAKSKLEADIHQINEETAEDVSQWVANAKSLEDDINRTRAWANEIVRRSDAPDASGKTIQEAEEKVEFLRRETAYNKQLDHALKSIKQVGQLLDQVELARDERRILDSLYQLEKSWTALDDIPVSKSCRVMKLLDIRAFELKSAVHEVFNHVWGSLVRIDKDHGQVTIMESRPDEQMSLADAVVGLKAYKEVDRRMAELWHDLDETVVRQRTSLQLAELPAFQVDGSTFSLAGEADRTVPSLYKDLDLLLSYLATHLPEDLINSLSNIMIPDLVSRIVTIWLDSAVPTSLSDMTEFQEITDATRNFCGRLEILKFSGFEELQEWVQNVPRVWLAKCRETALDSVRLKISQGLGDPQEIERAETQTVTQEEGQKLTTNGANATNDDGWDAWGDESADNGEQKMDTADDGADAWGWGEEDINNSKPLASNVSAAGDETIDQGGDDAADAWGWGDEDVTAADPGATTPKAHEEHTARTLTLKETYNISSMPQPVVALILTILEDGASLISNGSNPMSSAAAGLFSLPTLVLAMFRAVSPYYYALDAGGNMFLYNDATYISEQLSKITVEWKSRDDLAPRAVSLLRLENDIKALRSFAARAYTSEMNTHRTVLRDLLGGSQNLLQQDGLDSSELASQVDNAIGHVRSIAASWSTILAKSAWSQAVGSLVDAVASKLVGDVMDLAGIGQDDAFNIASLIARVTELDDLFLPPGKSKESVPATAQYASTWLRLKYLSEVLQSNLQEVRYLWMDSELSLYFTVDEVIELIGLSFVDNSRTREVVREIQGRPNPCGQPA